MKVLMTSNTIPSSAANTLKRNGSASGGWVEAMAKGIRSKSDIDVAIAFKNDSSQSVDVKVDGIKCISIDYRKNGKKVDLDKEADEIIERVQPDIIHIEGTEFPHSLAFLKSGNRHGIKTIVSWQTVLNGLLEYEMGQLPIADMMFSFSLEQMYLAWLIFLRKQVLCRNRMKIEQEIVENASYLLGRTTWDRAYSYKMNPNAKYYSCSRVLKPFFYNTRWDLNCVQRHSIYFGSAYTVSKGFHFMLYAMPQLIRDYPDVKLYVSGDNPYDKNDKRPFYRKSNAMLIKSIIRKLKLEDYVVFTGPISGEQVAEMMSKTHVYAMSSVIENSPNSFAEAMMIGMPCVISYQGGVPDMATDGVEALFFRNDDPALIAWKIKQIFDDDRLALSLSEAAKIRACANHNPENNVRKMIEIYNDMLREK